jgi:hypothetical protein
MAGTRVLSVNQFIVKASQIWYDRPTTANKAPADPAPKDRRDGNLRTGQRSAGAEVGYQARKL